VRLGVILPSFAASARDARDALDAAEAAGVHGAFVYDHLWPMGEPGKPAISAFPLLGALAVRSRRLAVGTLVARVGLASDEVLVGALETVAALAEGRLIAGLGTGDRKSAEENRAYGIAYSSARDRRRSLEEVAAALGRAGIEVWIGAGSSETNEVARRRGATLNLWGVPPEQVARAARAGPVSWAGVLPADTAAAAGLLSALEAAGATWAVVTWPGSVAPLLAAVRGSGIALRD